jgi:hypothetical protein
VFQIDKRVGVSLPQRAFGTTGMDQSRLKAI